MIWIGVAAVVVVLGVAAVALKRRQATSSKGESSSDPTAGLSEEDRVRRIAPAAPMVGLEAALDGVTDGQGRTLREQLDAGAPGVDQLRVEDDTSPILRRALDHVAPAASDEPSDEQGVEQGVEQGDHGTNNTTATGD